VRRERGTSCSPTRREEGTRGTSASPFVFSLLVLLLTLTNFLPRTFTPLFYSPRPLILASHSRRPRLPHILFPPTDQVHPSHRPQPSRRLRSWYSSRHSRSAGRERSPERHPSAERAHTARANDGQRQPGRFLLPPSRFSQPSESEQGSRVLARIFQ
jgi:hypothetical protein